MIFHVADMLYDTGWSAFDAKYDRLLAELREEDRQWRGEIEEAEELRWYDYVIIIGCITALMTIGVLLLNWWLG